MAYDKEAEHDVKIEQYDSQHSEDIGVLADNVQYGHAGLRGVLSSPYVLGAAFLASTGGFSWV